MNRRDFITTIGLAGFVGINTDLHEIRNTNMRRERLRTNNNLFNNVYKVANLVTLKGGKQGVMLGSAYNFIDKKDKSFYVSAEHVFVEPGATMNDMIMVDYLGLNNQDIRIEYLNKELDLAIVSTDKNKSKTYKSNYVGLEDMIIGEDLYLVGYPGGKFRCVNKSNVSNLLSDEKNMKCIIANNVCNAGYSGGAMFYNKHYAGHISRVGTTTGVTLGISIDNYKKILKDVV